MRADGSGRRGKSCPALNLIEEFPRQLLRAIVAAVCAGSNLLLGATQATGQSKLDRIEWFGEQGGSLFRHGQQPGVIQVPEISAFGLLAPAYQATVVDPRSFSIARVDFTGVGCRLTPRDLIEVSWSSSANCASF